MSDQISATITRLFPYDVSEGAEEILKDVLNRIQVEIIDDPCVAHTDELLRHVWIVLVPSTQIGPRQEILRRRVWQLCI